MTRKRPMICVRLEGGLGNQLFQYAAGRALALRHRAELVLDDTALRSPSRRATPRRLELQHFSHTARIATPREGRWLPLLRRMPRLGGALGTWRPYVERGLSYNAAFAALPDRTYLVGYWQSHRYFESIAETLVQELQPAEPLSTLSAEVAQHIDVSESVAVHVRRGDYITLQSAAAMHGALSLAYYGSAIAELRRRLAAPHFFIFSDEPEWCTANLPVAGNEVTFVSHNSGLLAWQDLVLMGRCRHHVIANSSFSWWGAWLGDRRAGTQPVREVLAPARWFGGLEHDTRDRFPQHWKAVSA